ncbi:unnamed protein product [Pleuronectes platessa]|uniref:Uncharacterized protein n=1 Tax=Pleuronectes platessa TaxID=8262 RepID=A0A9N7U1E9_PLEPL|nr:unnamed protein product [Pleuronectes platessa]
MKPPIFFSASCPLPNFSSVSFHPSSTLLLLLSLLSSSSVCRRGCTTLRAEKLASQQSASRLWNWAYGASVLGQQCIAWCAWRKHSSQICEYQQLHRETLLPKPKFPRTVTEPVVAHDGGREPSWQLHDMNLVSRVHSKAPSESPHHSQRPSAGRQVVVPVWRSGPWCWRRHLSPEVDPAPGEEATLRASLKASEEELHPAAEGRVRPVKERPRSASGPLSMRSDQGLVPQSDGGQSVSTAAESP